MRFRPGADIKEMDIRQYKEERNFRKPSKDAGSEEGKAGTWEVFCEDSFTRLNHLSCCGDRVLPHNSVWNEKAVTSAARRIPGSWEAFLTGGTEFECPGDHVTVCFTFCEPRWSGSNLLEKWEEGASTERREGELATC